MQLELCVWGRGALKQQFMLAHVGPEAISTYFLQHLILPDHTEMITSSEIPLPGFNIRSKSVLGCGKRMKTVRGSWCFRSVPKSVLATSSRPLRGCRCLGNSWASRGSRPCRAPGLRGAPPPSGAWCRTPRQTCWCTRIWGRGEKVGHLELLQWVLALKRLLASWILSE